MSESKERVKRKENLEKELAKSYDIEAAKAALNELNDTDYKELTEKMKKIRDLFPKVEEYLSPWDILVVEGLAPMSCKHCDAACQNCFVCENCDLCYICQQERPANACYREQPVSYGNSPQFELQRQAYMAAMASLSKKA